MTLYKWSQTASANATADSSINWMEGQAPSSVNDSARAMMASVAKYRDDISGAIVTGGTSTAYTVASNQAFASLSALSGQMVAFTPHATNGGTCTLNVDSLGAKPLRANSSSNLPLGTLIQGTPYVAFYNGSDGSFYLHGFYGDPYSVPLAGGLDYWAPTAPNSSFAFPVGQAISRTTYATLFSLIGDRYGPGDGSTTFNLPDKRDRVSVMLGGGIRISPAYMTPLLGAPGGTQDTSLTASQIPTITSSVSTSGTLTGSTSSVATSSVPYNSPGGATAVVQSVGFSSASVSVSGSMSGSATSNNTAGPIGAAFMNIQPSIFCNYIMRIL